MKGLVGVKEIPCLTIVKAKKEKERSAEAEPWGGQFVARRGRKYEGSHRRDRA